MQARFAVGLSVDEPLAQLRTGATHFYGVDGLGSITSLTTGAGAIAATYTYGTFGDLAASSGSVTTPFGYTARELDTEINLYFYRARFYDQATGRFLSEDPIAADVGLSSYMYVRNRPNTLVDPTGLLAELYCESISSSGHGSVGNTSLAISQARHCYIRVSCNGMDETIEIYGPDGGPTGRPMRQPFSRGRADASRRYKIYAPPNVKCCEFEGRLLQSYEKLKDLLPVYNPTGPNSNTFALSIIHDAGGEADFPVVAYGASMDFLVPPAPTRKSGRQPSMHGRQP